jgi:hypothetical protein
MIDLEKLAEAAEKATPSPWIADDSIVFADGESVALDCRHRDASFIALADPQTILKLIRVVKATEAYLHGTWDGGKPLIELETALEAIK